MLSYWTRVVKIQFFRANTAKNDSLGNFLGSFRDKNSLWLKKLKEYWKIKYQPFYAIIFFSSKLVKIYLSGTIASWITAIVTTIITTIVSTIITSTGNCFWSRFYFFAFFIYREWDRRFSFILDKISIIVTEYLPRFIAFAKRLLNYN